MIHDVYSRYPFAAEPNETPPSGVPVPETALHPLNGQMVTATYTEVVTGRLVDEGPRGAGLLLIDERGLLCRYVDGPAWTIEALPMEEPTEFGAMVDTDEGRALRTPFSLRWPWAVEGMPSVGRKWSELRNPRPVAAVGDQG
jgi:hypothetical protein